VNQIEDVSAFGCDFNQRIGRFWRLLSLAIDRHNSKGILNPLAPKVHIPFLDLFLNVILFQLIYKHQFAPFLIRKLVHIDKSLFINVFWLFRQHHYFIDGLFQQVHQVVGLGDAIVQAVQKVVADLDLADYVAGGVVEG
jgi:hypothetical protein